MNQEKVENMKGKNDKVAMSDKNHQSEVDKVAKMLENGNEELMIMAFVKNTISHTINGIRILKEALDKANAGIDINADGFESYVYHNEILDEYEKELTNIWDPDNLVGWLKTWDIGNKEDDIFDKALEKSMEKVAELSKPKKKAMVIEFKSKKVVNK